ncbi:MAG TPA: EamA family transporter [Mycobacteriales bacterium]|nr:EamA family transporter [Mycobacteriales bacterium]
MRLPAPTLAIGSMVLVQIASALSTHQFAALTPAGSAWLRLAVAGLVLLAVARPRLRAFSRRALVGTLLLGATTGLLTLAFIEAVARIPLGTAVAIEFLGPLGVAAVRAHRPAALLWPTLALAGVLALTEPWTGSIDLGGVGFALAAAAGWAAYLVLTQRVGAEVEGLRPLAVSMSAGALLTAPLAAGPALTGLTPGIALAGIGLGLLSPLLPYALELAALRRMTLTAFGTLMALEPGIATVLGLVLLAQAPNWLQAAGVVLVVAAGIGAQRTARTAAASVPASVEGRSQTNPRQTYAAA